MPVLPVSNGTSFVKRFREKVRMGASALVSALNALPWDDGESSSDEDEDDDSYPPSGSRKQSASVLEEKSKRPHFNRLGSSLHTIRPMIQPHADEHSNTPQRSQTAQAAQSTNSLRFPFRDNTIARRARRPNETELSYQYAEDQARRLSIQDPSNDVSSGDSSPQIDESRRLSDPASETSSIGAPAREMLNEQISHEEAIGEAEERDEIVRAAESSPATSSAPLDLDLAPVVGEQEQQDMNADAALRQPESLQEEAVEHDIKPNENEKRRLRKEKLAERLMEVFGLDEKEEVLEEMRCWLLRSVMLKGYMYLTKRHICFFANMPDKDNLIVKTGPLSKKNSRTKLNTKFWVILKNDVLSWYESTADPYFPKGNISLQYCTSCDATDELKFKVRTAEKNYTFTTDTEASRDEWIKAIQKVMFKLQHEGESVKLIIPLEAVMEAERSPTLEFAETIEIKCVDVDDNMSVESYFFASFQNNDRAYSRIQQVLDDRPSWELPRISSAVTIQQPAEALEDSVNTIRRPVQPSESTNESGFGIKRIGSVLKPLLSRSSDQVHETDSHKSGLTIPFLSNKNHKTSQDSLETVRHEPILEDEVESPDEAYDDGYPPRQSGQPPAGMKHDDSKNWGPSWIRKPASKILGTSPGSTSTLGKSPESTYGQGISRTSTNTTRTGGHKKHSVTEIVEPALPKEHDSSDDESSQRPGAFSGGRAQRPSFASDASGSSQMGHSRSDFSMMEASETGQREDDETASKFRDVFALSEKEELIDHFPGYLFRVLPVSGRFFISTNYFCFRSSQLLYKTKMIIPIKDLYGLKAQKAFRFGHSGLIVVIKGHEELFLEFSSSKRRKACVRLLEERMEAVRVSGEQGEPDQADIETRIMEDLDESQPLESRLSNNNVPPVSPSPLFGSTTSTFLEFKPEPMRVTCLTIGSRGDVQPYIALCKGLQAEGHTTRIATHGEYKDWVEGHGIEFASVGGDPAELMQMCVDNGMFTVSFLKEGLQKFRGWLDDLLTSSWEACQGSDLLIESPSAMGGVHIAEALRIPYYRAFTMPWTRTRAYPHAFAVPEHKRGGSYNYMTYTMFDQVFWRAISGQVNRWRRHVLDIESTTFEKLEQHKIPFLYNFSPSIVPPPLDWTEWIHVTGYWFLENADESQSNEKKWTPPEGLVDFIEGAHKDGKKVVYIGFGSIVVSDPEEMTRCVVDAVVESGVCAILSKGWSDRGSKSKGDDTGDSKGADGVKYPPEIFSIDSIDHSWLFPRIDAACHHGGAGTSGASFRAGIPTIIKPFFGDQAFWAERAESLNVGSAIRKLTSEALAEALIKATTDAKQIAKAKIVGEMIRKENGVSKAIEAIYRDLEYAKSIIKPLPEAEDKPLDKVTSLLHTDSIVPFRSRSRTKSSPSKSDLEPDTQSSSDDVERDRDVHASDDGWSVVSGNDNNGRSRNSSVTQVAESKPSGVGVIGSIVKGNELISGLGKALPISNPFSLKKKKDKKVHEEDDDEDEPALDSAFVEGTAGAKDSDISTR
uniref:Sterol 3-beta-glucosyltransferase n=1 Tax=Kwoniella pini CBS 10737 TaxID=1296096 RepID=A0A1B9IED5_9TREE|nr:sterol 3-beta-glucosyltransferase [Kwoniella pini CBS 10737]OCF53640.1 sterol 3-beta-glucosyltransferase [Kwoniella pini CBS 10737]